MDSITSESLYRACVAKLARYFGISERAITSIVDHHVKVTGAPRHRALALARDMHWRWCTMSARYGGALSCGRTR